MTAHAKQHSNGSTSHPSTKTHSFVDPPPREILKSGDRTRWLIRLTHKNLLHLSHPNFFMFILFHLCSTSLPHSTHNSRLTVISHKNFSTSEWHNWLTWHLLLLCPPDVATFEYKLYFMVLACEGTMVILASLN